jgi:hypothetical protein
MGIRSPTEPNVIREGLILSTVAVTAVSRSTITEVEKIPAPAPVIPNAVMAFIPVKLSGIVTTNV